MKAKAHPPSHFLGSCAATVVLGSWHIGGTNIPTTLPITSTTENVQQLYVVGMAGFMTSIGISMMAMRTFKKYRTPIPHGYQVQTIVRNGIFAVTRNPMYLSMVTGVASLALVCNTWWGGIAAIYLAGTIHWLVIPYEEAYLLERFGKSYEEYKATVPRWILFF